MGGYPHTKSPIKKAKNPEILGSDVTTKYNI
jgi:hypothetical protein